MDCRACGTLNPERARFCHACGARLATSAAPSPRAERKIVSVLFADMVGFTALAELLDPEDVEGLLTPYHDRLRADLERHGGTVEKFIGDAVMAVFGAPTAREDDAERSVRAALAIRDWAREGERTQVRIGVNTGEALVNLDARPELGQVMVRGDVVNTAARLQAAAPVNGVLVGAATYHATRSRFEYATVAPVSARGKRQRVPAWEPLDARPFGTPERAIERAPLIGRDRELEVMVDAAARAHVARRPQLLTLIGVPGMGKSRLLRELARRLGSQQGGVAWHYARSPSYGDGVSFWALGEVVKSHSGILESDDPDVAAAKLVESIVALLGRDGGADWVTSRLRPLVGLGYGDVGAGDRREDAFAAWHRYLDALAERQPTVLAFEDLHWADDGLLDFIEYLAERADGVALLVLATARPELLSRRPDWGVEKADALTLWLSPLSDAQTSQLVQELLEGSMFVGDRHAVLIERAGGNPLYAEEFARLVEDGRDDTAIPETIQAVIAARLDLLSLPEKRVLQAAAVLGRAFWLGGLADVAGVDDPALADMLERLERREFVGHEPRSSVAGETEYMFRHALIREIAYDQLPRTERAARHLRAARWIESLARAADAAEMLAHHYLAALDYTRAAGLSVDEMVAPTRAALRAAGERALALNAFDSAERFFAAALELSAADDPERPGLLFGYARALHATATDGATRALHWLSEELAGAGDRERAAEAETMSADLWRLAGDRRQADEHLEHAIELIAGAGRTASRARVLSTIAGYRVVDERYRDAIALGEEAAALARELGLPEVEARALANVGSSKLESGDLAGLANVERSLAIALAADSPEAARSYNELAVACYILGDLRRSRQLRRESMLAYRRYGRERAARFAEGAVIVDAFETGNWDEFIEQARRFAAESSQIGRNYQQLLHTIFLAIVDVARDHMEAGIARAREGAEWARAVGEPQVLVPALMTLAYGELELGMPEAARQTLDELATRTGATLLDQHPIPVAVAGRDAGVVPRLRAMMTDAGPRSKLTDAVRELLEGDAARAATMLDDMDLAPYAALARMKAAEDLAAAGRTSQAETELAGALQFWRSVGATRYVRRAKALLRTSGAGGPRPPTARRVPGSRTRGTRESR